MLLNGTNGKTNGASAPAPTPFLTTAVSQLPSSTEQFTSSEAPEILISPRAALFQKVLLVYEQVRYIQKDKRNNFHGYNYASEAAIKSQLHEAFLANGLILLPPEILSLHDGEPSAAKEGKEGKNFLTTIQVRFAIADTATGETMTGTTYGRGSDSSDKGIYKALTGALKYWLTTTFLIATGDDPEQDAEQEAPPARGGPRRPVGRQEREAAANIDTGGYPVGTREAAEYVGAQKIAAGSAATPTAPKLTRGTVKKMFDTLREIVGEPDYLMHLEKYGVRDPGSFKDSGEAMKCYQALVASTQTKVVA
jgi:hypothetical protein